MNKPLIDVSLNEFDSEGVQTVFAISPFGNSETRTERIERLEALNVIVPDCSYCQEYYNHPKLSPFMPSHYASPRCRSGSRNHCTCDTCF